MEERRNTLRIVIAILSVLLVISLLLLLVQVFTAQRASDSSVSPDNVVGTAVTVGTRAPLSVGLSPLALQSVPKRGTVTLSWWTGYKDGTTFTAKNLFPGDELVMEYTVRLWRKGTPGILFEIPRVSEDSGAAEGTRLSEVLQIKVEAGNTTLYSGSILTDRPFVYRPADGSLITSIKYRITVSLPTSVGNEYAGRSLTAHFAWYVEDSAPVETTTVETDPVETDPIETDPIETDPFETDPIETDPFETDPIETNPFETEPQPPPPSEHEGCCNCFFCHTLPSLFGVHNETCVVCRLATAICGAEETVCVCPWCCIVLVLLILALCAVIVLAALKKREREAKNPTGAGSGE